MLQDFLRPSSLVLLLITPAYAASPAGPPNTVSKDGRTIITRKDLHHDVSLPLRDLAANHLAVASPPQEKEADELKVIPLPPGFKPASEPDPVLQKTIPERSTAEVTVLGPATGLNFEGIGTGIPNFAIPGAPPDTEGAVGATQYVQWVNTSFAVFDKTSGVMTLGPVLGNTLWANFGGGCETDNDGDPIVTYDKLADRWIFSQFVVRTGPFLQCVAVSTSSDATGTYNRYSFEYSNFDDYPKMGVWPDAYYETFNMFVSAIGPFVGADACAYDRNAMLNGQSATQICFQQASTVGSLLPADIDGRSAPPAGSPNYMMEFDVNSLNLYKFHVDFSNPANSTFTGPVNIPVAAFTPFCQSVHGCVPQPGGDGTNLDSLGDRLMYRLAYRNFGDHESLVVNHSVVADSLFQNSGIRWYEIQNPNGTPNVAQQSTFAPADSSFRWMGSVAMDGSGNMAVGYSVTNSVGGLFPSIALATRGANDPPSTLQAETILLAGKGAQTNGLTRWGDYSAMQVDPVDDCTFWYTNEYLQNSGSFNWNTRIVNFKFPGCRAPALSIAKSHVGNFTQGQTGATYSIVVTNIGTKLTDGTPVTVTDTLPAGLTATDISSTDANWVCTLATLSCTRSDVLAPGTSYTPITVTVNVAAKAPGLVTNTATATGGGSNDTIDNTANDVTTVIVTGPDPAIAITNVPLVQNQTASYAITVTNRGLTATDPTQPVTVTDKLPAGLTATAIGSTDPLWVCTLATLTCTRSDSLASNQGYPPITMSVNVGVKALNTVVNTASVAGGGDVNPLNNTASDPATVLIAPPGLALTNPAVPPVPSVALWLKPGVQIAIAGTATGPSFQDYRLQWAEGINPSVGWSSTGITLAGGRAPVTNGPLGTWDTTGIAKGDYYTIRLTVDNAGFSNFLQTFVYLEPSLISQHWPIALDLPISFYSGFQSLADSSGKQQLFLVAGPVVSPMGAYLTFSPDGSTQTSTDLEEPTLGNPPEGQLDLVPGGDAVIFSINPANSTAQVQLFHGDGSSATIQPPSGIFLGGVGVIEDVEGAGQLDFVSLASNGQGTVLVALRPDGSLISGNFPVAIPDQNQNVPTFKPQLLVGDLHGNGSKEFAVMAGTSPTSFTLLQFAHNGTPIPWAVPEFSNQEPGQMVLADLDHNGMLETLLLVDDGPTTNLFNPLQLHVFQPDGTERPGFPVGLHSVSGEEFMFSQMAVGDLNGDGIEEIVVVVRNSHALNVLEPDGTPLPGFSGPDGPVMFDGSLALADIDGDGLPEIIADVSEIPIFQGSQTPNSPGAPTTSDTVTVQTSIGPNGIVTNAVTPTPEANVFYIAQAVEAIRPNGTVARTWNLQGINGNQPGGTPATITVGDFNNDGFTDIALNYLIVEGGGIAGILNKSTSVVLTTGTPFNAAANDWPLVYQNPQNTAVMRRAVTAVLTSPPGGSTVGNTVPITAVTTGNVQSVQFTIDGHSFGVPVTTAPFTTPWDTTQAAVGSHQLRAVATDSTGRPVASAPLTVNVVRGTSSTVTLALTAGASTSTFGDSLTFIATVAPNTATGSVTFFDGTTAISGAVPLSGGSAAFTTSLLAAGTQNISAQYSGDLVVTGSDSAPLTQTVMPAPLSVSADASTAVYGAPPNFSGKITGAMNGDVFTIHFSTPATLASPPGTYPVTPSVTGLRLANYTVTAVNGTLTITPAPLTITAPDGSRSYGVTNPQFIPIVTGIVNNDSFQDTASSTATPSSPVGRYPVIPSISGSNLSSYTVTAVNGTLTVTQAGSNASLTTSNASVAFGIPVTFTATVASATTGTPTGSVQFLDGTALLGTSPLNGQGVATLTATSLSTGPHSVKAQYGGDSNFIGSLSPAVSEQVIPIPVDFSVTASPSSATIKAGGSATFTFTVAPQGGFNQTVTFSCTGLPAESQCVFAPASVTPSSNSVTSILTITTTAPSAALGVPPGPRNRLPLYAFLGFAALGMIYMRRRSRVKSRLLWLAGIFWLLALLTSCGGGGGGGGGANPGTPAGTSQVTVSSTSGSSGHTSTVILVVTN